jgi:Uma2 family endonuclease
MTATLPRATTDEPRLDAVPPLHAGDHLDRAIFHERYNAMPEGVRAELVGGIVFLMTAVHAPHGRAHSRVITWLGHYLAATPGVDLLDDATVQLADDGEPQPDACLLLPRSCGGQTWMEGECIAGAPELVVEVAYSSEAYDLHLKQHDYERAGVREYVVVVLREPRVLWVARRGDRLEELAPGSDGWFRSEVFPGLWLDAAALLRLDTRAVLQALQQGLVTPEHAAFVQLLEQS